MSTATITLSSKGQIVIPKEIREQLHWHAGMQITLLSSASGVTLKAAPKSENAVVGDADTVSHALDWYAQGADFADALHLSACGGAALHTFDREFCAAARHNR